MLEDGFLQPILNLISNSGTDIILWHGKTGKSVGHVDTNQLKNNMATISPNGRFIAAAAFTADVKVSFNVQIYLIYFELLIHLNVRKHIDTTSTMQ